MIKIFTIGICDICEQQTNHLEKIVNDYLKTFDLSGQIYKFTEPKKLIESNIDYDAIFLGITFKDTDGIEIAHLLRIEQCPAKIIFVSSQTQYGVASYEVKAFNFIEKPVSQEKIFSVLHEVREEKRRDYKYLNTPNGEEKIDLSKVLYVDIQKRNLCCHLENGETICSITLKTSFENYIGSLAYHPDFVFIAPSLVININQIKIMNKDNLTFKNGTVLYFPKTAYAEINRRWKNPFR